MKIITINNRCRCDHDKRLFSQQTQKKKLNRFNRRNNFFFFTFHLRFDGTDRKKKNHRRE